MKVFVLIPSVLFVAKGPGRIELAVQRQTKDSEANSALILKRNRVAQKQIKPLSPTARILKPIFDRNRLLSPNFLSNSEGTSLLYSDILGFLGGALTTFGYIPQLVRILKLKSAREISLPFTLSFLGARHAGSPTGCFWF